MRRILRKYRSATRRSAGTSQFKQASPLFFDFNSGGSFFQGHSSGTMIDRGSDSDDKKRENNQLNRSQISKYNNAPGNVTAYINTLKEGTSLSRKSRQFFEPKFGADFSRVRIHNDKDSAEAAASVHAKAFTYKNHIVFNNGEYDPDTEKGKKLLSHELTHVIQQDNSIKRVETEHEEEEKIQKKDSVTSDTVLAKGPDKEASNRQSDLMPEVSQGSFDTCGAASLVAAIMIHDKQLSTSSVPDNSGFIAAANIVLSYFTMNRESVISGLAAGRKIPAEQAEKIFDFIKNELLRMRNDSLKPGAVVQQYDFQILSVAIYALHISPASGLSQAAIWNITNMLGIKTESKGGLRSYSEIINHSLLKALAPGQVAQIGWYVSRGGGKYGLHALIIGRLNNGTWYLYDQGTDPPARFTASSLPELDAVIRAASGSGSYWLFTGSLSDFSMFLLGGWTGINVLGKTADVLQASANLLKTGTHLAEIDAGYLTIGSDVHVDAFQAEFYDFQAAQSAASGLSGQGGAIIEMPEGRYLLFSTTLVSDANRNETSIDISGGGEFTEKRFLHAWLQLRSKKGTG
ncbi:MAG TPA: DUF4157 domain-containing protein, partial [Bacteroidales bacterium]|nr:DUF4157 domain-containing protein [Bacteroidales bacterium]